MLNRMSKFGIVGVLAVATAMFVTPKAALADRGDNRGGRVDTNRGGDRGGSDRAGSGWDRGGYRGGWGVGVGVGVPATSYETVCVVPGHWEDRITRVEVVPGRFERRWTPAVEQTVYDSWGDVRRVVVSPACYQQVWVDGVYDTRTIRVWVPPVYDTQAVGCVTTVVTSRVSVSTTFRW